MCSLNYSACLAQLDIFKFCSSACLSQIFGLDGLPEESHKHRINQNGVFIYEMMKLGVKIGCNIVWQYIVFNYNQDHIEQARQMAKDEGIEFKLSFSSRWNGMENYKPKDEYCA